MEQSAHKDEIAALNSKVATSSDCLPDLKQELEKVRTKVSEQDQQMDALADAIVRISLYHDSIHQVVEESVKMLNQGEKDQLFRHVLATAMELAQARFGILEVLSDTHEAERFITANLPAEIELSLKHFPQNKHLIAEFRQLAGNYCAALSLDKTETVAPLLGAQPRHNVLEVPLPLSSGIIRAVISLACKDTSDGFNDHDVLIMEMFATEIAHLLEREELMDALRLRNQELDIEKQNQSLLIAKLQDARAQLLQSEKMASIGQLAAGVAHEINNPVGFVNSNLGTLGKYIASMFKVIAAYESEEAKTNTRMFPEVALAKKNVDFSYLIEDIPSLLKESRDGLARVTRIVLDLKDFSDVEASNWQHANLEQGMDSTLNVASNHITQKATVVKEYSGLPQVECMPSQINQVFMNLLLNAAQAIDEKGTITIRTGNSGDEVWVEVEDTGKGIPPEHLNRIFDPFFTTKPVGSGTGLGLSLSYGIVQKHNGRIEVKSEVGKGSTFRMWLPVQHIEKS